MLHHIEIYVSDLKTTCDFWSALLAHLGYAVSGQWDDGFTLSNDKDAYLTFVQVVPEHADKPYHRRAVGLNHLAFRVADRTAVDALRAYCLEHGITCLYEARYPYANGGHDYYALFIEDPDRIKIEFVARNK